MSECKIYLKAIDKIFELNDQFNKISINDTKLYRNIALNYEDEIIISDLNNTFHFDKQIMVLQNVYNLNINESKNIKELYKRIEFIIKSKYECLIDKINNISFELIDSLSLEFDNNIECDESIDISKLLSAYSIKYEEVNEDNYLIVLINYLKMCADILKAKAVLSFGLSYMLSKEEIELLNKELVNIGICIVDILFDNDQTSEYNLITIDNDYCVI